MSYQYAFKPYIDHPEDQDVLYYDSNVVIIQDGFPKALRHYLLIPRLKEISNVHPLDAFNKDYKEHTGLELYNMMTKYVEKAKTIMMDNLQIELAKFSTTELSDFKSNFIQAGVHSIPSLKHLHIHVITKDFHSVRMKHKQHFNSFNTDFFVPWDKVNPLFNKKYARIYGNNPTEGDYDSDSHSADSEDEEEFLTLQRNESKLEDIIKKTPLVCPYCKTSFNFLFARLKKHLEIEFNKKYQVSHRQSTK